MAECTGSLKFEKVRLSPAALVETVQWHQLPHAATPRWWMALGLLLGISAHCRIESLVITCYLAAALVDGFMLLIFRCSMHFHVA